MRALRRVVGAVLLVVSACSALTGADEVQPPAAQSSTALKDLLLTKYLTNDELSAWGDEFVARCGGMARRFRIGASVRGVPIWGVEVSSNPGVLEAKPYFRYVANMHGNEAGGRMLLPMLAEWLCANNGTDERATRLVRDAHLFIIPTMNPDGFARRRRYNSAGYDLNRNFPDPVKDNGNDLRLFEANTQPEVKAIMNFTLGIRNWAGSANFHEGAEVVVYSWDGYSSGTWAVLGKPHTAPDDESFVYLSKTYATAHRTMHDSRSFPGGIVNGASWYPIYGGIADWHYVAAGCMELTIEASRRKYPPASKLRGLWEDNREAIIALPLAAALGGVRGTVTGVAGGAPLAATLYIKRDPSAGDPVPFYSSAEHGFYARPLPPGRHTVVASAPGFNASEAVVDVPADGKGVVQDFALVATSP